MTLILIFDAIERGQISLTATVNQVLNTLPKHTAPQVFCRAWETRP